MTSTTASVHYKVSPSYAWAVAIGAFCTQALLVFALSILAVNIDAIAADWSVSPSDLGMLSACMGFCYGFFSFVWGYLMDRIGARWTLSLASFVVALSVIGFGLFATGDTTGTLIMALLGIGLAGTDSAVLPKLGADWFAPSKRGKAFPVFTVGGGIGGFLVGIIAGNLTASFGWRASFIGMGLICLALAVAVTVLIRNSPASMGTVPYGSPAGTPVAKVVKHQEKTPEEKAAQRKVTLSVLKDPVTYKYGIVMSIWYIWYMVFTTYTVAAIQDGGFGVAEASAAYGIMCLGSALGNFVWSPMTDKLGRKPVFIGVMAGMGILSFVLYFVLANHLCDMVTLSILCFIAGLFVASTPVMDSSLAEHYRPDVRGTGAGVVSTISCIGRLAGPMIAAAVIAMMGGDVLSTMLTAGVAALACALSILLFVSKTGGKYGDPLAEGKPLK